MHEFQNPVRSPHRDAKSAIRSEDIPLPKLNVDGSNPFTRFYISHVELSLYEGLPGIVFRLRQPLPF